MKTTLKALIFAKVKDIDTVSFCNSAELARGLDAISIFVICSVDELDKYKDEIALYGQCLYRNKGRLFPLESLFAFHDSFIATLKESEKTGLIPDIEN